MADRVETIGIYSAYGFAKEAGYTGTKAEFEQGLKNSAEYADNAASSANAATNAKNAAVTAKTDAQAAQSAAETAQGLAEDAQAAAEGAQSAAEAAAASLDASTIARIDGFYENMGVGTADQLMASQKVHNSDPYIFRTSGGTSDIGNREELEIVGGSIVWNQLIGNDIKAANKVFDDDTSAYQHYLASATLSIKSGHKYLLTINGSRTISDNDAINFSLMITGNTKLAGVAFANGDADGVKSIIFTPENDYEQSIGIASNNYYGKHGYSAGDSVSYDNLQLFDLTAMFSSTIADHIYELEQAEAGAGVAWFRKYFPNDYYDYNPGELMHVTDLQSHDTVGFNLWDEEWELGSIDTSGNNAANSTTIRSKNYIPIVNATYRITCLSVSTPQTQSIGGRFYDVDKNYIGSVSLNTGVSFTPPSNARYMRFVVLAWYGTTYKNDICINLSWSGTRDGEYEPYVKHSYPLDSSLALKGVPKLTADGDLTYDGDIYKSDGTVERRYGIVDLGTLTWTYVEGTDGNYFRAVVSTKNFKAQSINLICREYYKPVVGSQVSSKNKRIGVNVSGTYLYVRDDTYTDAETYKAAMSGVYLVYELANPTTEEAEPYASPQIVDDWGTEEFVTTSIVPVGHNTSYPANLRDKLQHLPDLPDDDGYYMTQVDGTQMSLIRFRIPQAPAEDGTYVLKATVSNGTPTYTWEAVVEAEGGEG